MNPRAPSRAPMVHPRDRADLGDIGTTVSALRPVRRCTVVWEVRERIADAIELGLLAPGTPLPAERKLSQEFGVGRTSIREAIQGLMIAGYIERRGNRSVIAERLTEVISYELDRASRSRHLFELRQVLEPAIVGLASQRATSKQRATLMAIAAEMSVRPDEFRAIEDQFLSALGEACGNPLLYEAHSKTISALAKCCDVQSLFAGNCKSTVEQGLTWSVDAYAAIAEAIRRRRKRIAVAASVRYLVELKQTKFQMD